MGCVVDPPCNLRISFVGQGTGPWTLGGLTGEHFSRAHGDYPGPIILVPSRGAPD